MKKVLLHIFVIIMIVLLVACSLPAENAVPVLEQSSVTTTDAVPSEDNPIERATSIEELKSLSEQYIESGRLYEAYLASKKITEIAPENDEGYLLSIVALLDMSKSNYETIDDLLEKAFASLADTSRLVEVIKKNETQLAISWPLIPDTASPDDFNKIGNTCGNMSAGGLVASRGEWIYFSNQSDDGKLYKTTNMDATGLQKICDDEARFINVIGDTIYYCVANDGDAIYSIRTDGSQRTKLTSDRCEFVSAQNGWIYYGSDSESEGLYKMRTDGSEKTRVASILTKYPYVCDDWIYYVSKRDNGTLWRIPTKGGEPQRIVESFVYYYTISGDWVYYLTDADRGGLTICKMRMDGSEKNEIYFVDGKISTFNVADNYLYVSIRTNEDMIVIVDLSTLAVINEQKIVTENLFCAERQLYYTDWNDGGRIYKIDINNWNIVQIG